MENPIRMDDLGVPPTRKSFLFRPTLFLWSVLMFSKSPKEKVETKAGRPRESVVISFHFGGGVFRWSFTLED